MPPIWMLVLFTFSGTLGMHVFTPALPAAAHSLQASASTMQATISVYILGLAVGQPIYGPVSDGLGRRPVLLAGLVLFTLGGLWSMSASSADSLAAGRFFQALGGCAGLALGRAIVRDTSHGDQTVRRLALLNLVMLIGPALAPLVGQFIQATWGWRTILLMLAGLGLVNIVLAATMLRETAARSGRLDFAALGRDYRRLMTSRAFLGFAFGGGCATTSTYAFFAAAPFVFTQELHRPTDELGVYLGLMVLAAAIGSGLVGQLIARFRIDRLILATSAAGIAALALLGLSIWAGFFGWKFTLGTMMAFTFTTGTISPLVMARAMGTDPRVVGSAAGLYGAIQMATGALCTWLAGLGTDPAASVTVVLLAATIIGQTLLRSALTASTAPAR